MSGVARVFIVAALLVAVIGTASAYTRPRWQVGTEIVHPRWPDGNTIVVIVNTDAPNMITTQSQPFEAVRNMFELRSAYTSIRFLVVSDSIPQNMEFDGVNLVTFKDTPENRSASFGYGAVTMFLWQLLDDEPTIVEADIVFNPTQSFTTTGSGGEDIENLGGHELIHFMCFDHSGVMGSTGYPNIYTEVPNERNLALDDRAAGDFIYPFPETPSKTGALTGLVKKSGNRDVFGAHVVALREADGRPVSDISVFGGEWRIDGLPPGQYTVYVEPLDGPAEPSNTLITGIYTDEPAVVTFKTTFAGGNATPTVFNVGPGAETSVGTIQVSGSAGPLNLRGLGLRSSPEAWIAESAVNVRQGETAYLTVHGPGVDQVPDDGIRITGSGVDAASAGILRGDYLGDPYMVVPLTVDPAAAPGVRTIFADDGTDLAALTGGIEVHPDVPYPNLLRNDEVMSLTSVAPPLSNLLPLDPTGPDNFPGTGEGVLREIAGSNDDDDLYVPRIEPGFLDPDLNVLMDAARPLVLYQLDDPNRVLFLGKSDSGRIVVTYTDLP